MDDLLNILNEELRELKQQTRLAEQRLDLQREDLNKTRAMVKDHNKWMREFDKRSQEHTDQITGLDKSINRHQAGFETLFQQMQKFDEKLDRELSKLRKKE